MYPSCKIYGVKDLRILLVCSPILSISTKLNENLKTKNAIMGLSPNVKKSRRNLFKNNRAAKSEDLKKMPLDCTPI